MENYFVNKAKRKGLFKARLVEIANDVEYIIKLCDGSIPFPSRSHIDRMIERYDTKVFKKEKFKHAEVYRSALGDVSEGRLPVVDRDNLERAKREFFLYFHDG